MSDVLIMIVVLSPLVGVKHPLIGATVGALIGVVGEMSMNTFAVPSFILSLGLGGLLGYVSSLAVRWLFSGFRGGRGPSEPGVTYSHLGGFGTARSGQFFGECPGGMIPTHDEEAEWIRNKQAARARWFMIALRYLFTPLLLVILILLGLLLMQTL